MTPHDRLKQLRYYFGFTQVEMAGYTGVQQGTYSDIERGRSSISPKVTRRLNYNLGVSQKWLKTGEGHMFMDTHHQPIMAVHGTSRGMADLQKENAMLQEMIKKNELTIEVLQQSHNRLEETIETLRNVIAYMTKEVDD